MTNNGSWKLATSVLGLVLVCGASTWGMIEVHAGHPHAGTATDQDLEAFRREMAARLDGITTQLNLIREDISR